MNSAGPHDGRRLGDQGDHGGVDHPEATGSIAGHACSRWIRIAASMPEEWEPLCEELKHSVPLLPLTASQQDALDALLRVVDYPHNGMRFAVRSFSPDEDLTSASFAGGYETLLGVHPDDLEGAVRDCFASSLDVRVLTYKKTHGFDVWSPRLAVIVQRQIDSEIAGVAFSLNPATNDYDEAIIEANWGLGTSVVEGLTSPRRAAALSAIACAERNRIGAARGSSQPPRTRECQCESRIDWHCCWRSPLSPSRPHRSSSRPPRRWG